MRILSSLAFRRYFCLGLWLALAPSLFAALPATGLVRNEYITVPGQTAFNYSPTLVQTTEGILIAWIGGSDIDSPDASVYLTRNLGGVWASPEKIASSIDPKSLIQSACRKPVLFKPANRSLVLFYQTETNRRLAKGLIRTSNDNGKTWIRPKEMPKSISGPSRVKPIELSDGVLLCGGDSHEAGWVVHVSRASAFRRSWGWSRTKNLTSAIMHNAREPVLLNHGGGNIQALCRTKRGYIVEGWSDDNGESWERFERTAMPNPDGGLDVVKMGPQSFVMVYQHSNREKGVMNLATTKDGRRWSATAVLENQPGKHFSDPAIVRGADGNIHVVYAEDHQRIKYVVLDPSRFSPIAMVGGNWPY